jgi:hypothetical protein
MSVVRSLVTRKVAAQVVRKERAVGIIPKSTTLYEVLEDLTITVDRQLLDEPVPFCAFNGGGDVFVDIGNKNLGLHALKKYLGTRAHQVCCQNIDSKRHMLMEWMQLQHVMSWINRSYVTYPIVILCSCFL